MRALEFHQVGTPLRLIERDQPTPGPGCVVLRVAVCGVCRTDLHIIDGELPPPGHPVVPGHKIVGVVEALGAGVNSISVGERIGVPWLGWTCGHCRYCDTGQENLCDVARFTGYQIDGGYADYVVADARYCFPIPPQYGDAEAAPMLCAGLIGYRAYAMALAMAGNVETLGLYGFGAAAHILAQVAVAEGRAVYAFTRRGDHAAQALSRKLGAAWAGASEDFAPAQLDAAIIFAPAGTLVPQALAATRKGGAVICAGIHMSDIPAFPYRILWGERRIASVTNLTRADGEAFFRAAARIKIETTVHPYPLIAANQALNDLREGRFAGAAVLVMAQ